MRLPLALLLALATLGPAHAEGCPPKDGKVIPVVEEMNALIVAGKFQPFVEEARSVMGVDWSEAIDPLAAAFSGGFKGCTTIAQRVETGGMVQEIVTFDTGSVPLFAYWMIIPTASGDLPVHFMFASDVEEAMQLLR